MGSVLFSDVPSSQRRYSAFRCVKFIFSDDGRCSVFRCVKFILSDVEKCLSSDLSNSVFLKLESVQFSDVPSSWEVICFQLC